MDHPQPITAVTLSADGSRAATSCKDGTIRVFDLKRERREGAASEPRSDRQGQAVASDRGGRTVPRGVLQSGRLQGHRVHGKVSPHCERQNGNQGGDAGHHNRRGHYACGASGVTTAFSSPIITRSRSGENESNGKRAYLQDCQPSAQRPWLCPLTDIWAPSLQGRQRADFGPGRKGRFPSTYPASCRAAVKWPFLRTEANSYSPSPQPHFRRLVLNTQTRKEYCELRGTYSEPDLRSVACTSDGKTGVLGFAGGKVLLWDLENNKEASEGDKRLAGHTAPVHSCAYSADGRFVLTGAGTLPDKDCTAPAMGDGNGARSATNWRDTRRPVTVVALSRDNRQALTVSQKTTPYLGPGNGRALRIDLARKTRVARNRSPPA